MEKRRPLRDDELLRDRDRAMLRSYLEGRTAREVGRIHGISESMVCRRLKAVPASVRARIRDDVRRTRNMRLASLRDEVEAHA